MKNTFQISIITFLGFLLLIGCTKDENFEAIEMDLQCLSGPSPIIIQSQEEYENAKTYNNFECDSSSYPEINFNKYTLIGVESIKTGCGSRPVTSEVKLKRGVVTMYFEEQEDELCQSIVQYSAWYKISKTASDKIEFDIDEVR